MAAALCYVTNRERGILQGLGGYSYLGQLIFRPSHSVFM